MLPMLPTAGPLEVGAYYRVSTDGQTTDNQRAALDGLANARGWVVRRFYDDTASGVKERPELERLMLDARRGAVRVVVVWALDRLGRSMHETIGRVLELDRLGVRLVSLREPWLDQADAVRKLLLAVFAWVAEQERTRLVERTRAGLDRARRQGKRLGRPPTSPILLSAAADLVAGGSTLRAAARAKGVAPSTLGRFIARRAV